MAINHRDTRTQRSATLLGAFVFVWFLQAPAHYGYRVVKTYPHDRMAFTQGLEYRDGFLYEGTGLAGRSSVRRIDLATGKVLQNYDLPQPYFGEGITLLNQQIFQITYQTQTGFVYDRSSFRVLRSFSYPGEGWGLTNDGKHIYMSDGTADIRVWDPATLKEVRRITVKDGLKPVLQINELEWVRGELYANIWHSDRIARISPGDGKVLGWIDLSGILPRNQRPEAEAVLNGIAYDPAGDRLFVTGKLWPSIFEIRLTPKK